MLGDEHHAARDVTKTSAYRMDTFQTRELGVLGWVDGSSIKVGRAPARVAACDNPQRWATPFDLSTITAADIPRTEIVYSYQQAGGEAITGFADAGVKGIVTAGTGAGGLSGAQGTARTAAVAKGVVFISTTRTGSGRFSARSTAIASATIASMFALRSGLSSRQPRREWRACSSAAAGASGQQRKPRSPARSDGRACARKAGVMRKPSVS